MEMTIRGDTLLYRNNTGTVGAIHSNVFTRYEYGTFTFVGVCSSINTLVLMCCFSVVFSFFVISVQCAMFIMEIMLSVQRIKTT